MKHAARWLGLHRNALVVGIFVLFIVMFLGGQLSPTSNRMFTFHDGTQAARVQQFTLNVQNLQIPPRMAPEFSYGMGYPVFNFYAPFTYWVTSILSLVGLSTIAALKLSFLLAIIVGFLGMYLLLRELLDESSGLLGGMLYVTSAFIPIEIFVRGNLSEMWFIALFPLALFLLVKNSRVSSKWIFVGTILVMSFLFTVHNIFSLISVVLIPLFLLLLPAKRKNLLAFIQALALASYFVVPALFESGLTYASAVASQTHFNNHFLCVKQLWSGPWGFGGSVSGCEFDGMSFALGKPQILLGSLGGILLARRILRKRYADSAIPIFVALLTVISLFLTLYQSQFMWNLFFPVFSLFQFPWRFLVFGVFGLAFLGGYCWYEISRISNFKFLISKQFLIFQSPIAFSYLLLVLLSIFSLLSTAPLFSGQSMSNTLYESMYLSDDYIRNTIAYKIPEYLPKTADYDVWKSFEGENTVPYSEGLFRKDNLNMHYFPYWRIVVDGKEIVPTKFDNLGRPLFNLREGSRVEATYQQTIIEQASNVITLVTGLVLLVTMLYKPLWTKIQKIES